MENPKEFKFKVYPEPQGINIVWDGDFGLPRAPGEYHVIEYSAYALASDREQDNEKTIDALVYERDELQAQNEALKAQGDAQTNIDLSIQVSSLIHQNASLHSACEKLVLALVHFSGPYGYDKANEALEEYRRDSTRYISGKDERLHQAEKLASALESIKNNIGFGGKENLSAAMSKIEKALEEYRKCDSKKNFSAKDGK